MNNNFLGDFRHGGFLTYVIYIDIIIVLLLIKEVIIYYRKAGSLRFRALHLYLLY